MAEILPPYKRATRPVQPESFPRYVEYELDKVATALASSISSSTLLFGLDGGGATPPATPAYTIEGGTA